MPKDTRSEAQLMLLRIRDDLLEIQFPHHGVISRLINNCFDNFDNLTDTAEETLKRVRIFGKAEANRVDGELNPELKAFYNKFLDDGEYAAPAEPTVSNRRPSR